MVSSGEGEGEGGEGEEEGVVGGNTKVRKYSGTFMFMEFAITDLSQLLLSQYVTKRELLSFINEILDAIHIMADLHIYHGDLHIGNVFIVNRNNSLSSHYVKRAVIGDFGESFTGDERESSPTSHLTDIINLFFLE